MNFLFMFKNIFILLLIIGFFAACPMARAQDAGGITVTPHIIDVKAKARDILEYNVVIKNNSGKRVTMYVLVYDVSPEDNHYEIVGPGKLDKSTSITRWVNISRGAIELDPGEELSRKLTIEVNLRAKPGKYYAAIVFSQGRNITIAKESFEKEPQPELMLNIEVEENIVEKAQAREFKTEKNIFFKTPVILNFSVANSGNRDIIPDGYVYIYNRKSQEIAKLPANASNESIAPEESKKFTVLWDQAKSAGKFKAKLELEYGQKERHDLSETFYFWTLPWQLAALFGGGLMFVIIILTVLIFKKTYAGAPGGQPFFNHEPTVDLRGGKK